MTQRTHTFTDDDGNQYLYHELDGGMTTLAIRKPFGHWGVPIFEDTLHELPRDPLREAEEIITKEAL
jgi:hypothetical protein